MRPRSTVWRAASLAETPIENLIWEIPLNSRCATEQGAPRKPPARPSATAAARVVSPSTEWLTENELSDFSRLWHDGCVKETIEAQDVDRNHSSEVSARGPALRKRCH